MKPQHTPTPWKVIQHELIPGAYKIVTDNEVSSQTVVQVVYKKVNAVHIVRAVNSHEELVSLLRGISGLLACAGNPKWSYDGKPIQDAIRQAIAKAEGKGE